MKRLVMLGGGHSQIQVVKSFAADPPPDTTLVLINRGRHTPYSGMLPGLIAGHYTYAQAHIDLERLCARGTVAFIEKEVVALDLGANALRCADGSTETFDLLSIDTGATPPLARVPGALEHALAVKPIEEFLPRADRLVRACRAGGEHRVALVGGGAAGFEVLLALAYRIEGAPERRSRTRLHWITDTAEVLPDFPACVRRAALRILARRGVEVHTRARVERVDARGLEIAGGLRIAAEHVVWATGAAPAPMFAQAGFETDARGFVVVDPALRSRSHPHVFASGDVASVAQHPRPKAGVFAVRQGPPLTRNLRLALAGAEPLPFEPQQRYLVILSAGSRYAIATKFGLKVEGRWVWRWKDRIDRGFMRRFQAPQP